jgi:hypothetical protein
VNRGSRPKAGRNRGGNRGGACLPRLRGTRTPPVFVGPAFSGTGGECGVGLCFESRIVRVRIILHIFRVVQCTPHTGLPCLVHTYSILHWCPVLGAMRGAGSSRRGAPEARSADRPKGADLLCYALDSRMARRRLSVVHRLSSAQDPSARLPASIETQAGTWWSLPACSPWDSAPVCMHPAVPHPAQDDPTLVRLERRGAGARDRLASYVLETTDRSVLDSRRK